MNYLARGAREGFWTGIGVMALLWGLVVIGGVLLVAFAVNPLLALVLGALLLHWLCPHKVCRRCRGSVTTR